MSYKAVDVAKFIVRESYSRKEEITHLKLQKLLFFAWADYFKATKKRLFDDEFRAWKLGPVVPPVYDRFRVYMATPIVPLSIWDKEDIAADDANIIRKTMDQKKSMTPGQMVQSTHEGPWKGVFRDGSREEIPFSLIEEWACSQ
jgi:uncharacterized phage-associated protein